MMRRRNTGFTLIELMIVLVVAAALATVAVPNLNSSMVNGDLRQATADVSQALRIAKSAARARSTNVSVVFVQNASTITLTSADSLFTQTIQLPNAVTVTSADATYQFLPLGTVGATGSITLTSSRDTAQTRTVTIVNLAAQITSS